MNADSFLLRHRLPLAVLMLVAFSMLSACGGDSADSASVPGQSVHVDKPSEPSKPSDPADSVISDDAPAFVDPAPPADPAPPPKLPEPPAPQPPIPPVTPPDPQPSQPPQPPRALRNLAAGDNRCLAVSETNGVYVGFQTCSGKASQQWRFERDGAYFRVKNALSEAQGRDDCLRASSDVSGAVKMGPCAGKDYPTTRLWRGSADVDGLFPLYSKHWSDVGRKASLQSQGNTLAMLPETDAPAARWYYDSELPPPLRPVRGDRKILLVASHWEGVEPAPAEPIRKAVFGDGADYASLSHYVALASRGALRLSGEMITDVDLGAPPAGCPPSEILERARAAARARGVDPDKFDYVFVDVSRTSECKFVGLAGRPGNWVISNNSGHAYWMWTHEFGHALGADHPDSLQNCPVSGKVVTLDARCVIGGVDDPSDTMGGGGRRLYPVSYHLFAGWLDTTDVPLITQPGTYRLAPLWREGGKQGYRLRRDDGSYLLLEFRRPQPGFDDWPADSPFVNGVIVRIVNYMGSWLRNTLVDTTPGSAAGMKDAPLMPGRSLDDTGSRRRITVLSADADGATVRIDPL